MTTLQKQLSATITPTTLIAGIAILALSGCVGANSTDTKSAAAKTDTTTTSSDLVEIKLVDKLDDDRGYCVDVAGGQGERAPLDRGLQAHTCYDYTGKLLVDQEFDANLFANNQIKLPYFDVCMTASSVAVGAAIELASCTEADTQKFTLAANGNLTSTVKPELCVTVNSSEKREGRGGSPVHVMRPLSLQNCSADSKAYQTWTTFKL